ncbi:MAG: insulinase family protein [Deltaproteobacteria bacterium]|nr:insulinase family protein [Deltaproteobacteria bacterium]
MIGSRSTYTRGIDHILRAAVIAGFMLLLLGSCVRHPGSVAKTTETGRSAAPAWPHEKSDLAPDPDLYFGKLDNGFRFVLMHNHNPAGRVSMHLDVQVGSMQETDDQQGVAHFLEHMVFNGSEHFKPGELVKYFQSIGMAFGADANAHTGYLETVYDIFLPSGDRESLEKGLLVMHDYAGGALLLQSEVDRERNVILSEKRSRDSAGYRTFIESLKFELPEARVSHRPPIGTEAVLNGADSNLLRGYYDAWYRPEKMILVAVGDFDVDLAASLVEQRFNGLEARGAAGEPVDFGRVDHEGVETFNHYEKEAGSTTVTIEVLTGKDPVPDSKALQKEQLLSNMADRIVQNRLDAEMGRPGVPGTDAVVGSGLFLNHVQYAMLSAEGEPEAWEKLLAYLDQTLRKALEFGFTDAELARVKKELLAELSVAVQKKDTRESKVLARQLIRTLNADRVPRSPDQDQALLGAYIQTVKLPDVNAAFRKGWSPDQRLVMVTGNADLAGGQEAPRQLIAAAYNRSQQVAVSPPADRGAVTFPYLSPPVKEGGIKSRTSIEDLGIVQVEFANGFRLNLKKTDFKDNEILANLSFGKGRSEEPEALPGLAELSTEVIAESGFGHLDKADLDAALAGKNTSMVFNFDASRFMLQCHTVPDELELMFALMYAQLQDPGFRKDAFALADKRFEQRYKELAHTVDGAMTLQGWRFLAGGDGRFGLPPYEDFSRLTLDQVHAWVGKALKEEPLELSVVGDFETDRVIDLAGRYFGTLDPRLGATNTGMAEGPVFPAGKELRIELQTENPNALVLVAYPTDDMWNISRTRRLAVLADLFSERLRTNIREKLGESYSPYAYNRGSRAYKGYGYLAAVVETDPKKVDRVVDEIRKIASGIAEQGVSEDELHRALEPTLNRIRDMRNRNGYWLSTVLTGASKHPLQLAWSRTIEEDYASINLMEEAALAKRYLIDSKATVIVVTPAMKN